MKEQLVYTIDKLTSGKNVFIGKTINYPSITIQATSEDELKEKTKKSILFWLEYCQKNINKDDIFDLVLVEKEEDWFWFGECNTTYWEIDRFIHLIKKNPEFLKQAKQILNNL